VGTAIGTKLGPYEVLGALGAGGMGEVYRARDPRLGREVALKLLPGSFLSDASRLQRFEQEARAAAALNHPNILAVHDIGQQDGLPYIVTELLKGETLRERLRAGALPIRKAIDFGEQIARGLAAAHEKGIVHRDLKPENIFVTDDGRVKILDFGLAKLTGAACGDSGETLPSGINSEPGAILGTVGYMSPEQVRGEAVDPRTDIFSFGAVLYEALSGRPAFKRETWAETMTAILKEDPAEFAETGSAVPPGIERVVRRCLEKSPPQRFQSAKDLAFALEAVSGGSSQMTAPSALTRNRFSYWKAAIAMFALLGAIAAGYVAGTRQPSTPARFQQLTFQRGYIKGARFAPDGQNVIYSAEWEGRPYEVFSTRVGSNTSRSLELGHAMLVGVSAAGEMAVLVDVHRGPETNWMQVGTLARAPASGGATREILEGVWDADISRDGRQFTVVRASDAWQQLEYPIGKILFKTQGYISHPRISPDGTRIACLEHPVWGDDRGYVTLVDSRGNSKRLTPELQSEEGLAWNSDGTEILYGGNEPAQSSGARTVHGVTPDGKSRNILDVPGELVIWDVADGGRLLVSNETMLVAQFVASPATEPERNVSELGYGTFGVVSPDGKAVAFTESGHGTPEDYLVLFRRLDGSAGVEIGEGGAKGMTPDGKYVVAAVPSQPGKLRILPTGPGEARTINTDLLIDSRSFVSWMPGGKEFIFQARDAHGGRRGYRVSLDGGPVRPLTNQKGTQLWNRISPDGRLVVQQIIDDANTAPQNVILDLSTGRTRPAPIEQDEAPAEWDQDGRHIFVVRQGERSATIFRVDAFTGHREVWKQVQPADLAGILSLSHFYVTPSANAYAYSAARILSQLYIYSKNE